MDLRRSSNPIACGPETDRPADHALSDQEAAAFFAMASVGMVQVDPDSGRILRCNQKFCDITGYSAEELLELSISQLTHPEDRVQDWECFGRAVRGETPHYLNEKRYCRKDGTVVWVRFNASFLRDGGGRALRTAAVCEDVTARKQAELALQESEDFNTSVLNSIVDHLAVLDASGTIVAVNEAWKRFALENGAPDLAAHSVGLSYRASCTGAPGDSSASQTAEGLRAVLAGERPNFQLDYPCHSSDRERWFHLRITPLKGRRGGAIVSHTDITHRNRAEAALRESEDLLQRIGEIAKVGAWELDLRTHQVTWSQETCRIHEVDTWDAPTFENAVRFYPPDAQPVLLAAIARATEHGMPWDLELPLITARGRPIWVRVQGSALWENGRVVKLGGAFHDITERRQVETEKNRLALVNQHLEKAESLGRMAGAIAHHYNNQLQAVIGNIDLALSDLPPTSSLALSMGEAMRSARKAAEMSGLMLTYLGQHTEATEPLDLGEITEGALDRLSQRSPPHIPLLSDLPSPGPSIRGNSKQFQHVLSQLLTNAWEAIGTNAGTVRVSVKTVAACDLPSANRAPISWRPSAADYACLEVADTGCGIEPQTMDKIFDPFFSTKFVGRGLGLPVVLGVVRAWQGAVSVESAPGRGSTFRLYFPRSLTPAPRRRNQAPVARQPDRRAKVLVVDDEPAVREFAMLALTKAGHTVTAAANGLEAAHTFAKDAGAFDCVICDVTMPGMNGWETLTALRRLRHGVPVILMSGHREEHVMAAGTSERPHAFLQKPYDTQELCQTLRHVLAGTHDGTAPDDGRG